MSELVIGLVADAFVAILLLMTISYSWKLNKRIRVLQDSKSELAELIGRFEESTEAATTGINEIHKASRMINDHIEKRIKKANYVADDLAFMIEKGGKVAEKIQPGSAAAAAAASDSASPRATRGGGTSRRSLQVADDGYDNEADEAPASARGARGKRAAPRSRGKSRDAEREAMMAEAKVRAGAADDGGAPKGAGIEALAKKVTPGNKRRSLAETELLQALKGDH